MTHAELQDLIKECLGEVLSEGNNSLCPYCELLRPSHGGSHGFACKEHAVPAMVRDWGMSEAQAKRLVHDKLQKNPNAFSQNTSGAKETDPLPQRAKL
jgi:hypothetical protein